MSNQTSSDEVERVIDVLAALPGGLAMNITAKRYPRLGPAEPGTSYEENTLSFRMNDKHASPSVPRDAEEVVITLEGDLPGAETRDHLLESVTAMFEAQGISPNWDMRARVSNGESDRHRYEVTVFTDLLGGHGMVS